MLARKLPKAKLHLGDGTITLSRKIGSHLAQAAIDRCKALQRDIKDADDPVQVVEDAHRDWDILKDLIAQITKQAEAFRLAADAMDGKVVEGGTSPLIELALTSRASADTLELLDDSYDDSDVRTTAKLLRDAANALFEDLSILKSRAIKHDMACRELTLRAASLDHTDLDRIQAYEFPDGFEVPKRMTAQEWFGQKSQNPDLPPPRDLHTKAIRTAAKRHFVSKANAAESERKRKRAQQRKQLQSEIRELWA